MLKIESSRNRAIQDTFAVGLDNKLIHLDATKRSMVSRSFEVDGKTYADFVTCSYFDLDRNPVVIDAVNAAALQHGTSVIVSRTYLSSPGFHPLETSLAAIFDAFPVVTPSTTLGHFSFMNVMVEPGHTILLDQQVHNSVQLAAATRQRDVQIKIIPHNNLRKLESYIQELQATSQPVWYMADGIYSMFGDAAPVRQLLALMEKYEHFYCYIDDAHGMGILGRHGRGYVMSHFTEMPEKLFVALSLSKCFGAGCGGVLVAANRTYQQLIRTLGSTMIFSSPMPPPMLGAAIKSADIFLSSELPKLQRALANNIGLFRSYLDEANFCTPSSLFSPVQYVLIGSQSDAVEIAKLVMGDGFLVNICAYPAVPKNKCGIRITIGTDTTEHQISGLVHSLKNAKHSVDNNTMHAKPDLRM
jgi:7-keto-8-aminopelargonate synthetase-like enzyme